MTILFYGNSSSISFERPEHGNKFLHSVAESLRDLAMINSASFFQVVHMASSLTRPSADHTSFTGSVLSPGDRDASNMQHPTHRVRK